MLSSIIILKGSLKMQRVVLPFDKEVISEEEIKSHIKWYREQADKGIELRKEDKAAALEVLKLINSRLKEEYRYYKKSSVEKYITAGTRLMRDYEGAVTDAYVNQQSKTSYDMLSSNLYDVSDYMMRIDIIHTPT